MGKLTEAIARNGQKVGPKCKVGTLLGGSDKEFVKELAAALKSDVQHATLSRALDELGHTVRAEALRRHRAGECSCGQAR